MGQIKVSSPAIEKTNLIRESGMILDFLKEEIIPLMEEATKDLNEKDREKFLETFSKIVDKGIVGLSNPDLSLEEARETADGLLQLMNYFNSFLERLEPIGIDVRISRREGGDFYFSRHTPQKFTAQTPISPEESRKLTELRKLSSLPALGQVNISKDLVSSLFISQGDILEIGTEEEREKIADYQKKGKLLFGSLEGLSGGTAYFKSVSIALAKILNEQSLYSNPDRRKDKKGGLLQAGIPKEYIREVFGASAKLEAGNKTPTIQGEVRSFPYIILSYERLAKELSKTGRISGGKDIDFVRLYINGGYKEFTTDPKTGNRVPVKSSYVPGLTSKKYPISDGRGHFVFIPFLVNEGEIVDTTKKDPEVGCLLRLSPQFSKTLRGYTALRGDTIQLIGGAGRQRDITMDILSFLAFSRGATSVLKKRKKEILSKYENKPTYSGRPGKLETHFKEAIEKAISAKILLPGKDSDGVPLGYREETSSGGDKICVFKFNPDYLKGEDSLPEIQSGEEE